MSQRVEPPRQHPDIGIIGLMPERWGPRWSSRHHVMARLARVFPVVWVCPPHERPDILRRAAALLRGELTALAPTGVPGLVEYTPEFWLPHLYRPAAAARLLFRLRLARAANHLRRRGARRLVLYLWRAEFHGAPDLLPDAVPVYHVDDDYAFSDQDIPTSPEEEALLRRADLVIVHSAELMRKKGATNPRTALVPNGVDFAAFAASYPEPAELAGLPHPRIGYAGAIKKYLDWPLLEGLALRHPTWSFIFVGDRENHPEIDTTLTRFGALPNVHMFGVRPSVDVPAWVRHFDVCILPYALVGHTRYIYPLKLNEYFASGNPVVGTPIPSLVPLGDLAALATDLDGWSAAIAAALADPSRGAEARQAAARAHDWDLLVDEIGRRILDRFGAPGG